MRATTGVFLAVLAGCSQAQTAPAGQPADSPRSAVGFSYYSPKDAPRRIVLVCEPATRLSKEMVALDPDQLPQPGDSVGACAMSAGPPQIAPLGDAVYYVLTADLRYRIEEARDVITIPAGFITDLASIPEQLWSHGLPRDGQYMSAAILHDYLYWDQRCKRDQADLIFLEQMDRFGVSATKAAVVYNAVRVFGQGAWNTNAAKKKNEIRVIPKPILTAFLASTFNSDETLDSLQKQMKAKGFKPQNDPGNPNIASTCKKAAAADATPRD